MGFGETFGQAKSLVVSGANSVEFEFGNPVVVEGVVAVVDTALTVAAAVLTVNHQKSGGGALAPTGAAEGGTCTIPQATAVGKGVYLRVAAPFLLFPGERLSIISDGGPGAGNAQISPVVRILPFQKGPSARVAADPGGTDTLDHFGHLTKVTS